MSSDGFEQRLMLGRQKKSGTVKLTALHRFLRPDPFIDISCTEPENPSDENRPGQLFGMLAAEIEN